MYQFATVLLLGLAVAKVVDLARYSTHVTRSLRLTLGLGVGVVLAWIMDYSMFAGWEIDFRSAWMGPVATGLVIGGLAALWHEVLEAMAAYAHRPERAGEPRVPTAA